MLSSTKIIRLAIAAAVAGIVCSGGASAASRNYQTVGKRAVHSRNNDNQKKNAATAAAAAAGLVAEHSRRNLAHEPTPVPTAGPTSAIVVGQPRQIGPGMTDEPTGTLTPEPTMGATSDNVNQMILEEFEEMVVEEIEAGVAEEPTPVAGTLVVAGTDQPTPMPTPMPTPEATKPERVTDEPTGESEFSHMYVKLSEVATLRCMYGQKRRRRK